MKSFFINNFLSMLICCRQWNTEYAKEYVKKVSGGIKRDLSFTQHCNCNVLPQWDCLSLSNIFCRSRMNNWITPCTFLPTNWKAQNFKAAMWNFEGPAPVKCLILQVLTGFWCFLTNATWHLHNLYLDVWNFTYANKH